MLNTALAILLILLAGCTTIGDRLPPSDWPKLDVVHYQMEDFGDLQRVCGGNPLFIAYGCAKIDFPNNRCNVVTMK